MTIFKNQATWQLAISLGFIIPEAKTLLHWQWQATLLLTGLEGISHLLLWFGVFCTMLVARRVATHR